MFMRCLREEFKVKSTAGTSYLSPSVLVTSGTSGRHFDGSSYLEIYAKSCRRSSSVVLLCTCILEAIASNLGRDTGYLDGKFSRVFSQLL
jgi:hypothetical protein